jgi:hypothetical protein
MLGLVLLTSCSRLSRRWPAVIGSLPATGGLLLLLLVAFRLKVHREHGRRSGELVHVLRTGVAAAVKTVATASG